MTIARAIQRDYDALPLRHREVINECLAEAWRNVENGDPAAQSEPDVAADIAQRLVSRWNVITYPDEPLSVLG